MPFTVTKYPQGTFCWADVSSTDIQVTKKFMCELMSWRAEDMPTGGGFYYTMFYLGKHAVAGGSANSPDMKGVPSRWNNYVSVDDLNAMTDRAVEHGATVVMEPMDVLEVGRMSCIKDTTGANLFLWQPKKHIGAMGWNELYTKDHRQASDFYSKLFDWTFETSGEDSNYWIIKNGTRMNGGMMELTPEMVGMPPMWMTYFTVANIENTLSQTKKLGGQVHLSKVVPQGKLAMLADPTGATFFVIKLSVPPDEWTE